MADIQDLSLIHIYTDLKQELVLSLGYAEITAANAASLSGKLSQICLLYTSHGIIFSARNGMLFITLPSGRSLAYVKPKIGENRFGGDCITYGILDIMVDIRHFVRNPHHAPFQRLRRRRAPGMAGNAVFHLIRKV